MKKCLLILLNFNNIEEIHPFLLDLEKVHPKEDSILIDDGSTDGSESIAERLGYRIIRNKRNVGVGVGMRTGIQHGLDAADSYDAVVFMSCNGKMKPGNLKRMLDPFDDESVFAVQGSRFAKGGKKIKMPWFRQCVVFLFSAFSRIILKTKLSDVTCGFRAFRLSFFCDSSIQLNQEWLNRYGMEYYILTKIDQMNKKIVEIPVTIDYSHLKKNRMTKIRPILDWWAIVRPFIYLKIGLKK